MDWSGCELVEVVPGKVSGAPLVVGTRIPADDVLNRFLKVRSVALVAAAYPSVTFETLQSILTYAIERIGMDTETLVDWSGCAYVERVPGRCSGAPTVVGTRVFPDTVAEYYWSGATAEEIVDDYPSLTMPVVQGLIEHVRSHDSRAA